MLRLTACFLITSFLFIVNSVSEPQKSVDSLTRLTNTPEHALNLNPTLSADGKIVAFESSGDSSFHAVRADLTGSGFKEMGATRAVSPALSSDGRIVVFASMEDLVGRNADRNSEIYLFDGVELKQLTGSRLIDGSFQPSITSDGRVVAYSSNGE